ncbi:alpha/beta hydrolase [Spirosoma pollinicola]|uniref:Phospholipase n=1 Tax=Spirosoma pollinicola TaxID=2057025 RepID=A0A2K8Z9J1_9BACT|nr:phospholipase [Spirosoma pollinicola]AUD06546.1 phospholipase [Spirosoma pollinicola]
MTTEHHLTVQRTARYYTIGKLSDKTKNVWFCLHGFGQLAQYFSRKFTNLDDGETLIVVPEGLSRSYLDGTYNRIGASWLTREDREHEISDFLAYLDALYVTVLDGRDTSQLHITLLGFSQGAATVCRWFGHSGGSGGPIRADRLILWAGYFPHGFHDLIDPVKLTAVETHYVYGQQDEYIALLADAQEFINRLQTEVPTLKITAFEGGHRVEPAVLKTLLTGFEATT